VFSAMNARRTSVCGMALCSAKGLNIGSSVAAGKGSLLPVGAIAGVILATSNSCCELGFIAVAAATLIPAGAVASAPRAEEVERPLYWC
jgi:hypothetical protein